MDSETVWRALSSQHRRRLLDLMRDGPRTTGQLAKEMPGLTRFAVMQHLGVLEQAGLVLVRREGRNRFNYSNPSLLRQLYEQWVSPIASTAAEAAQHIRRYVESSHETIPMQDNFRIVRIEMETRIAAPRAIVYKALTEDYAKWWPHKFRPDGELYFENRVGGNLGERWPDGGGALFGTVTMLVPNEKVVTTSVGMMGDYTAVNRETLTEDGDTTVYAKSLHMWGIVSDELERMLTEGSRALMEQALKSYCEGQAKQT